MSKVLSLLLVTVIAVFLCGSGEGAARPCESNMVSKCNVMSEEELKEILEGYNISLDALPPVYVSFLLEFENGREIIFPPDGYVPEQGDLIELYGAREVGDISNRRMTHKTLPENSIIIAQVEGGDLFLRLGSNEKDYLCYQENTVIQGRFRIVKTNKTIADYISLAKNYEDPELVDPGKIMVRAVKNDDLDEFISVEKIIDLHQVSEFDGSTLADFAISEDAFRIADYLISLGVRCETSVGDCVSHAYYRQGQARDDYAKRIDYLRKKGYWSDKEDQKVQESIDWEKDKGKRGQPESAD